MAPADDRSLAEFAVEVVGLYEIEVRKRKAEHDCLQGLRDKGVIR